MNASNAQIGVMSSAAARQEAAQPEMTETQSQPSLPSHMFRAPYRPILDPLPLHNWWYALLIPICILTAIAYKSVRSRTLEAFYKEVLVLTGQLVIGMVALGVAAWIVLGVILPRIAPMPGI